MSTNLLEQNSLESVHALMNSHFMYNVLNGLQAGLLTDGPEENFRRFQVYTGFVRGANESVRNTQNVAKEWAFIQKYMKLEKERFLGETEYLIPEVDASPWADKCLPTFVIQPFLENEWQKKRTLQEAFKPEVVISEQHLEIRIPYKEPPAVAIHSKLTDKMIVLEKRLKLFNHKNEECSCTWSGPDSTEAYLKLNLMNAL